jgi:hypothetical protein
MPLAKEFKKNSGFPDWLINLEQRKKFSTFVQKSTLSPRVVNISSPPGTLCETTVISAMPDLSIRLARKLANDPSKD